MHYVLRLGPVTLLIPSGFFSASLLSCSAFFSASLGCLALAPRRNATVPTMLEATGPAGQPEPGLL